MTSFAGNTQGRRQEEQEKRFAGTIADWHRAHEAREDRDGHPSLIVVLDFLMTRSALFNSPAPFPSLLLLSLCFSRLRDDPSFGPALSLAHTPPSLGYWGRVPPSPHDSRAGAWEVACETHVHEFVRQLEGRVLEAQVLGGRRQDEAKVDVDDVPF